MRARCYGPGVRATRTWASKWIPLTLKNYPVLTLTPLRASGSSDGNDARYNCSVFSRDTPKGDSNRAISATISDGWSPLRYALMSSTGFGATTLASRSQSNGIFGSS